MSDAPERIWAWEYKGNSPWGPVKPDLDVVKNGAEYLRADHVDALLKAEREKAQVRAADALAEAHGKLWSALAEIIEAPGMSPNATVRRMAARAEKALVEDTIADLKPVPRFYKEGGA